MGDDDGFYGYTRSERYRMAHEMVSFEGSPYYPDAGQSSSYQPTFDPATFSKLAPRDQDLLRVAKPFENVYKRVMSQSAPDARQLAEYWSNLALGLNEVNVKLRMETEALRYGSDFVPPVGEGGGSTLDLWHPHGSGGGWRSNAADAFMERGPGATLKSLYDWIMAAWANSDALHLLANTIDTHQHEMGELFEEYRRRITSYQDGFVDTMKNTFRDDPDAWPYFSSINSRDDLQSIPEPAGARIQDFYLYGLEQLNQEFAQRAWPIEHRMAKAYVEILIGKLTAGRSTVFEGPDNAVMAPAPGFGIPGGRPGLPNAPGAFTASPPALPPPAVQAPTPPALPGQATDLGQAPDLGQVPVAPGLSDAAKAAAYPGDLPSAPTLPTGSRAAALGQAAASAFAPSSLGATPPVLTSKAGAGAPLLPPAAAAVGTRAPAVPPGTLRRAQKPGSAAEGTGGSAGAARPGTVPEAFAGPGEDAAVTRPVLGRRPAPGGSSGAVDPFSRTPTNPGAAPPVLGGSRPTGRTPAASGKSDVRRAVEPGADGRSTAAPAGSGATAPVLGRSARAAPTARAVTGTERQPERARRRKALTDLAQRVADENERISRLLNDVNAWAVDTPGGSVLDNKPEPAAYRSEPPPALSAT